MAWSFLPGTAQGGYLPHWLLFISVVSIFNSIQTYQSKDLALTKKVYDNAAPGQVTNLSARTFGTWTLVASIVRAYGAYFLYNNRAVYELVLWTFVVAGGHFISEWLYYRTIKFGKGLAGPLVVSTVSFTWMVLQRDFYLGNLA